MHQTASTGTPAPDAADASQAPPDRLMSCAEVALWLGVSLRHLQKLRQRRDDALPSFKIGRSCIRFRRSDVDRWLAEHQGKPCG